jgi:hypothetical protein
MKSHTIGLSQKKLQLSEFYAIFEDECDNKNYNQYENSQNPDINGTFTVIHYDSQLLL